MSDWTRLIPREDLSFLHHVMRMFAEASWPTADQKADAARIADALWEESVARSRNGSGLS